MRNFVSSKSSTFYSFTEEQYYDLAKKLASIKFKEICEEATSDDEGTLNLAVNLANIEVPENVTKLSLKIVGKNVSANETTGMKQPALIHDISLTHSNASSALTIQAKKSKLICGSNDVTLFISAPAETSIELTHFIATGGAMLVSESTTVEIGKLMSKSRLKRNDF